MRPGNRVISSAGAEQYSASASKAMRRGAGSPDVASPDEDGFLPTHIVHRRLAIGSGVSAQHIAPRLAVYVEDRDVVNRRRDAAVEPAYPQRLRMSTEDSRQPRAIGPRRWRQRWHEQFLDFSGGGNSYPKEHPAQFPYAMLQVCRNSRPACWVWCV
jgi:hypothetical protein